MPPCLDLDWGREGGGWGRIKTACTQLLEIGVPPQAIFAQPDPAGPAANLAAFDNHAVEDFLSLTNWANVLRQHGVFFCSPLDLDYSMLLAFPAALSSS